MDSKNNSETTRLEFTRSARSFRRLFLLIFYRTAVGKIDFFTTVCLNFAVCRIILVKLLKIKMFYPVIVVQRNRGEKHGSAIHLSRKS